MLIPWGLVADIMKWVIIGPDNGLSPAITWINVDLLSIRPSWTKFCGNFNESTKIFIEENAFGNVVCKMAAICLGINVLIWASPDSNVGRSNIVPKLALSSRRWPNVSSTFIAIWVLFQVNLPVGFGSNGFVDPSEYVWYTASNHQVSLVCRFPPGEWYLMVTRLPEDSK